MLIFICVLLLLRVLSLDRSLNSVKKVFDIALLLRRKVSRPVIELNRQTIIYNIYVFVHLVENIALKCAR